VGLEIARKNGSTPGAPGGGTLTRILAFVPVLILIAIDPRRRPVPATLAYGVGLLGFMGLVIGRTPAFEPMVPGPWPTAAALVVTLGTAFVGGIAARWLSDRLSQSDDPSVVNT
jgi:peptidoglycan/LPS O-acetylase OafA/YrhL